MNQHSRYLVLPLVLAAVQPHIMVLIARPGSIRLLCGGSKLAPLAGCCRSGRSGIGLIAKTDLLCSSNM